MNRNLGKIRNLLVILTIAMAILAPPRPAFAQDDGPASGCGAKAQESFFPRLVDTYKDHLNYWEPPAAAPSTPSGASTSNAPSTSSPSLRK